MGPGDEPYLEQPGRARSEWPQHAQQPQQYAQPGPPPPALRHAPGNLAGTAIVCLVLGMLLGGAGVYFFVPDRAASEGSVSEAETDPNTGQTGDPGAGVTGDPATGDAGPDPAAPDPAAPDPAADPAGGGTVMARTEEAVRGVAALEFDRYAAGDYGGAWDLWSAAAKQTFSRDDYIRLHELCPDAGAGVRFTIDEVIYQEGADTATVRASRLVATSTRELVYEDGGWRFVPDADAIAAYQQYPTADALAEARRAEGSCGE